MQNLRGKVSQSLYDSRFEHDSCGIGFIARLDNTSTHKIIIDALKMLTSMEHRGGCGCDVNSGDGAGILIRKPHEFLVKKSQELGFSIGNFSDYGVAQIFFPKDIQRRKICLDILKAGAEKLDLQYIGFRKLETDNTTLGESPRSQEPYVEQHFFGKKTNWSADVFERKLFVLRNCVSHQVIKTLGEEARTYFYICSCSCHTLVYKGQFNTSQLRIYYLDLIDEQFKSSFALIHSRFSTNTLPQWRLAQPFRFLAHNGEINTIKGNINWMKAREHTLRSSLFSDEEMAMLLPICDDTASDSANLDAVVELLVMSGRSLPHVLMMLIPEAWQEYPEMELHKQYFYRYHAQLMEPWDGPASLCFTDGKFVGACLDRNGLRPSRYTVLKNGTLIMASEAGVLDVDPDQVIKRGRLQPGKIFILDLEAGKIITDEEIKSQMAYLQPYEKWISEGETNLKDFILSNATTDYSTSADVLVLQQVFGYTSEDIQDIIVPFALTGQEPISSMGMDIALPILSEHPQHLSHYFKQLFAQVTNPPIDPIREKLVMSLFMYLGSSTNLLEYGAVYKMRIDVPILTLTELETIKHCTQYITEVVDITWQVNEVQVDLKNAVQVLCDQVIQQAKAGVQIFILSDKNIDKNRAPIPSLMAVGAIHHTLINAGLRDKTSLILETADAWETHHFATLFAYGIHAVCPYLVYQTLHSLRMQKLIKTDLSTDTLVKNYIKGICYELRKILSKMGISTLQSYHGAQIFEILGLNEQVVGMCFKGSVSRIGGLGFDGLAKEILIKHALAFPKTIKTSHQLEVGGIYQWKRRGEYHLFNPQTVHLLQQSTRTNNYALYKEYAKLINDQSIKAATLRGLLTFTNQQPISIEEVESAESILKRFATGAMSFGSISHEAHSTLAIAMNRIGAKSNSGEGGEDPIRFFRKANGDWERSAIKQVASGRFGVTSFYLTNADELQIKIAQGAKPGEGGQLPRHKVDEWIARVRHSTPGVGLISPPPHHDIYSIEDLAQLIFDLKNANRQARVSVKLVSEAGVGTVATGVAKSYADVVLIAGHDGGTGASPLSSIRHAGLPWELGLSETHQTLVQSKLRNRIVLQADGQIKTGRDIAIATLLGAEEWGVATAALVVEGCILMRKCHLNTCPVGIATQNALLRKRFAASADHVVTFFYFLVNDLREIMASLGFRTINEMVGRSDKLKMRDNIQHWKHQQVDLSRILYQPDRTEKTQIDFYCSSKQPDIISQQLDFQLIKIAAPALITKKKVQATFLISNQDRATGTMLSNEITKLYHGEGLPDDTIHFKFEGSAGQSFAAFSAKGLTMEVEGEANDYFGKGLSGSKIIIYPFETSTYEAHEQMIVGNVCLYGATSGKAFINGLAGERFCVRNSGAMAVVEGVGDHGCEYMTGGLVIVLGEVGRNFAAGMSGGIAYVFNEHKNFANKCNKEMVDIEILHPTDFDQIKKIIEEHQQCTKSKKAATILTHWEEQRHHFIKIMPQEYKAVLLERAQQKVAM